MLQRSLVRATVAPSAAARSAWSSCGLVFALGVALSLAACGGDEKPPTNSAADVGAGQDTGAGQLDAVTSDAGDAGGIDGKQGDVATSDVSGCPGGAGCACSANSDCDQSMCLETRGGSKCAKTCTDATSCATGQVCTVVKGGGGDDASVCVEPRVHLCDPCKTNAACVSPGAEGAKCVDRGPAGSFCGVDCGAGQPACPTGSTCGDVVDVDGKASKQCMPANDAVCSCSPIAIQKELATSCSVGGAGAAACSGVRACLAAGKEGAPSGGGLSICLGGSPVGETCNGADDDCDGTTDEDADCDDNDGCTTDACVAGTCTHTKTAGACDDGDACTDADTCATGSCAGVVKTCDDSNPCTVDTCDKVTGCVQTPAGLGDPCDDGDACTAGDACTSGVCAGTPKACDDGNSCTKDACDPTTGKCGVTPSTGSCDDGDPCTEADVCGADAGSGQISCMAGTAKTCDDSNPCTMDTCDKVKGCVSVVDVTQTQACYTANPTTKGVGACKAGVQTCTAAGSFGACVGEVGPAAQETCNGKDDTCNGKTDDGCVGGGPAQLVWRFGSTVVEGSNANGVSARVFAGGSSVVGSVGPGKTTSLELGFYAWLTTWLK